MSDDNELVALAKEIQADPDGELIFIKIVDRVAQALATFEKEKWKLLPEEDDTEDYYVTVRGKKHYRAAALVAMGALEPYTQMRCAVHYVRGRRYASSESALQEKVIDEG